MILIKIIFLSLQL